MMGHAAVGEIAISGWRAADDVTVPSNYQALLADPDAPRIYLVEASPYDPDTAGVVTRRWSTSGYESGPSDTPANTHFQPRVSQPLAFGREISRGGLPDGRARSTSAEIVLTNGDGDLDALLDWDWKGRVVTVKMGAPGFAYADFGTVFSGTAAGVSGTEDEFTIRIRDFAAALETPIQSTTYAGTGAEEGGDDVKGLPKPRCFGRVREVPAVLVEAGTLLYQVNDGAVSAITAVYDNSASGMTDGGDHATVAALRAASLSAGTFETCEAEGYFRIAGVGGKPTGQITADVDGAKFGGTFYSDPGTLIRKIAVTYGGLTDPDDFDSAAFSSFEAAVTGVVGLWVGPQEVTTAEVLDRIAGGVFAAWGGNRLGELTITRFAKATGAAALTLTAADILEVERLESEEPYDTAAEALRVGYRRIWHVPDQQAIAGSVSADRQGYLAREYRRVEYTASPTGVAEPATIEANSIFDTEASAQAEADRLGPVFAAGPGAWRIVANERPFSLEAGQVVFVTYSRLGLADGHRLRALAVEDDGAEGRIELIVWGE